MNDLHAKINSIWQSLNNCFVKEDGVHPRSLDVLQFSVSFKFIVFPKLSCVFSNLDFFVYDNIEMIYKSLIHEFNAKQYSIQFITILFFKSNGVSVIFD